MVRIDCCDQVVVFAVHSTVLTVNQTCDLNIRFSPWYDLRCSMGIKYQKSKKNSPSLALPSFISDDWGGGGVESISFLCKICQLLQEHTVEIRPRRLQNCESSHFTLGSNEQEAKTSMKEISMYISERVLFPSVRSRWTVALRARVCFVRWASRRHNIATHAQSFKHGVMQTGSRVRAKEAGELMLYGRWKTRPSVSFC